MPAAVLAFLMSTIGRYVVIGAVVVAVVIGIRQSGVNSERRKCVAAAMQRQIEINERDTRIGALQADLDKKISAEIDKSKEMEDAYQRKLEAEIAKRPIADQCRASPDDIGRLR